MPFRHHLGRALPRLATSADPRRWLAACQASGQPVTPFHTYRWLSLAAQLTKTHFVPVVVTHDGVDVGVAPLLLRRRGPLSLANWAPFPYLGPLVPQELLADSLLALNRRGLLHGVVRQQQCFPPGASLDPAALTATGFSVDHDETFVVDTSRPVQDLWLGLESRCRRQVRKAERRVVLSEARDGTGLRAVVEAAFSARGLGSGYFGAFPGPKEFAGSELRFRHVVATAGGHLLGSLVTFAYGDRALLWQGGVLPEARSSNANVLMHWDAIRWAHETGARSIDLVGIPDDGIRQFKSQFGGTLASYVVARREAPLTTAVLGRLGTSRPTRGAKRPARAHPHNDSQGVAVAQLGRSA